MPKLFTSLQYQAESYNVSSIITYANLAIFSISFIFILIHIIRLTLTYLCEIHASLFSSLLLMARPLAKFTYGNSNLKYALENADHVV